MHPLVGYIDELSISPLLMIIRIMTILILIFTKFHLITLLKLHIADILNIQHLT